MTIEQLLNQKEFQVVNKGENIDKEITKPYCCDLLSIAMSRVPQGAAWVTVMANINTLAVATLTDAACVILAEGMQLDLPAQEKARSEGVTVLKTELPIFEAAALIQSLLD